MQSISNHIGGMACEPFGDEWLPVYEPATGQPYAQVAASGAADVAMAVQAAQKAFPGWSSLAPETRSHLLMSLADALEDRLEALARAESRDTGKPLTMARGLDIPRAARNFRFFAAGLLHFSSESHDSGRGVINYTLRQPLGVVAAISPWNLPLYLLTWKIAPALAAGNCVVAKPSEITPLTASLLGDIAIEIGLPPGVLNIVHGTGPEAGAALVGHPDVAAVTFTGSTQTGAEIARIVAPQFKKHALEMGGKNAALIFADCDYEQMLDTTVRSSFSNQGQICLCTSRLLVEASLYERFCNDFVARAQALQVGDPLDLDSDQGAVVSAAHQQKILQCIHLAQAEGGEILCGGSSLTLAGRCLEGWFVAPTVITGLGPESETNQTEIFGPVVTIQSFHDEDEALVLANASRYGLAATVWTENIGRAQRLSAALNAGLIWVNTWMHRDLRVPFGGLQQSGVGREGGWEAFRFFTEAKNVCIQS